PKHGIPSKLVTGVQTSALPIYRLLPEHVRVVRPRVLEPVALGEPDQLEEARVRRVGQDGDAEAEHRASRVVDAASLSRRRERGEIGRASCRGRVWSWGVAGLYR